MRSLVVAGGVAANSVVRRTMAELAAARGLDIVLPPLALCTDNAAMIALAGEFLFHAGYRHGLDLDAVPGGGVSRGITGRCGRIRPDPMASGPLTPGRAALRVDKVR
jgi:hypothetical protein